MEDEGWKFNFSEQVSIATATTTDDVQVESSKFCGFVPSSVMSDKQNVLLFKDKMPDIVSAFRNSYTCEECPTDDVTCKEHKKVLRRELNERMSEELRWIAPGRTSEKESLRPGIWEYLVTKSQTLFGPMDGRDPLHFMLWGVNERYALAWAPVKRPNSHLKYMDEKVVKAPLTPQRHDETPEQFKVRQKEFMTRIENGKIHQAISLERQLNTIEGQPDNTAVLTWKRNLEVDMRKAFMAHNKRYLNNRKTIEPQASAEFDAYMQKARSLMPTFWQETRYLQSYISVVPTKDLSKPSVFSFENVLAEELVAHDSELEEYQIWMCKTPTSAVLKEKQRQRWRVPTGFVNVKCITNFVPIVMASPDTRWIAIFARIASNRWTLHVYEVTSSSSTKYGPQVIRMVYDNEYTISLPDDEICGGFGDISNDQSVAVVINNHLLLFRGRDFIHRTGSVSFSSAVRFSQSYLLLGTVDGTVIALDPAETDWPQKFQVQLTAPENIFDAYMHGKTCMIIQIASGLVLRSLNTEADDETSNVVKETSFTAGSSTCGSLVFVWSNTDKMLTFLSFQQMVYPVYAKSQDVSVFTPKLQMNYRAIHAERDAVYLLDQNGLVRKVSIVINYNTTQLSRDEI